MQWPFSTTLPHSVPVLCISASSQQLLCQAALTSHNIRENPNKQELGKGGEEEVLNRKRTQTDAGLWDGLDWLESGAEKKEKREERSEKDRTAGRSNDMR